MTYDAFVNILRKNGVVYEYDSVWKDRLVKVGNETITYDVSGCPTMYRGYAATWQNGRIASFGLNTYEYNCNGIRTRKIVDGVKHRYVLEGSRIVCEKWAEHELVPMYDAIGNVYGIVYDDAPYFFMRNLQGDILSIVDKAGNAVAEYAYDAWGKCEIVSDTSGCDIASVNPFRYRGYYYDAETELYYLNSRYYDAEVGRFISADDINYLDSEMIGGVNLYAYCVNNPIMGVDWSGHLPQWAKWLIGGAVIVGLGVATFFTGGAAGVVLGAAFYGAITGAVSSAIIGGVAGAISGGLDGFLDGAASGFMSGAIIGGITGALSAGVNIASGGVQIVGSAQRTGNLFHRFSSNIQAGKFAMQVGRYSKIGLNSSLKKVGLSGARRPDVSAVARFGKNKLVEVVSKSQTVLSQQQKISSMIASNPGTTGIVISSALQYWFYF